MAHCSAARKIRRELDEQLKRASVNAGQELLWTPAEEAIIGAIQRNLDRQAALQRDWDDAADAKTRVKISGELRLLEAAEERLLRQVKAEAPEPRQESRRTVKARAAANARWQHA